MDNEKYIHSNFRPLRINHIYPSYTFIFTNKNSHVALIVTGADETIMNIDNLPRDIKINESLANIVLASGNKLNILGQAT